MKVKSQSELDIGGRESCLYYITKGKGINKKLFQAGEDDSQVSVISGWGQYPTHPVGWQGLFYYEHPVLREKEGDGVYIYPDWTSCVQVS